MGLLSILLADIPGLTLLYVLYCLPKFETNTIFNVKLTILSNKTIGKLSNQTGLGAWFWITFEMLSSLRYKTTHKFSNDVHCICYPNLKHIPFSVLRLHFQEIKRLASFQTKQVLEHDFKLHLKSYRSCNRKKCNKVDCVSYCDSCCQNKWNCWFIKCQM